jgi:hypothetical protein
MGNTMSDRRETITLDKKIGFGFLLSLLLAICTAVGAVFSVYVSFGSRLSSVESAMTYQRGASETLKADTNIAMGKMDAKIDRVDAKLDRLLERR